jgi:predicted ATPase
MEWPPAAGRKNGRRTFFFPPGMRVNCRFCINYVTKNRKAIIRCLFSNPIMANMPPIYVDPRDPSRFILPVGTLVLADYEREGGEFWYFGMVEQLLLIDAEGVWNSIGEQELLLHLRERPNKKFAYSVRFLMGALERFAPEEVDHQVVENIGKEAIRLKDGARGRIEDASHVYSRQTLKVVVFKEGVTATDMPLHEVKVLHLPYEPEAFYTGRKPAQEQFLETAELGDFYVEGLALQEFLHFEQAFSETEPVTSGHSLRFDRHINVFFGENGIGKTNFLRLLLGALRFDDEVLQELAENIQTARYRLELVVGGKPVSEERRASGPVAYRSKATRHASIPILGIGSTRSAILVSDARSMVPNSMVLGGGAFHEAYCSDPFLRQDSMAMSSIVLRSLYAWSLAESFAQNDSEGLRQIINQVFQRLTGREDAIYVRPFVRKGYDRIDMMVDAEGAKGMSLFKASQGTFSVITMFVQIYSYLESLHGQGPEVAQKPGIVAIDEIDAHLHPKWQAKILHLLHGTFPNVQFFATAHNTPIKMGLAQEQVFHIERHGIARVFEKPEADYIGLSIPQIAQQDHLSDIPDPRMQALEEWFQRKGFSTADIAGRYERLMDLEEKGEKGPEYEQLLEEVEALSQYQDAVLRVKKQGGRSREEDIFQENQRLKAYIQQLLAKK